MDFQIKSIRPFIGAKKFDISRQFYRDIGFREVRLAPNLSLFQMEGIGFYLQNAFVKDWVDNTMVFLEVGNVYETYQKLSALQLTDKYENVRLEPIRELDWGRECFLHDPSGILFHFGEFTK